MRTRTIKPSFFDNENLADCQLPARMLFIGLWCLADKEGRLEDRPRRIKAEIYPYDNYNVDELLDQLVKNGLIIRYEVDGLKCIQIPNFGKHQKPHNNETESALPPVPHDFQPRPEALATMVESTSLLILDPSSLDPSSLDSESKDSVVPDAQAPVTSPPPSDCPHEKIIALYHKILPQLPRVQKWGEAQRKCLKTRWSEDKARQSLEWWSDYFQRVSCSDWLCGRVKEWTADLGWIIGPKNFGNVLNGRYDNKAGSYEQAALRTPSEILGNWDEKWNGIERTVENNDRAGMAQILEVNAVGGEDYHRQSAGRGDNGV